MSNFLWNISLFFIRMAWLDRACSKPKPMATWWHIGRLYWCIHPRFGLNYRTKAYLKQMYITHQDIGKNSANNLKELWESIEMIYSYVETLNVGILKGHEYLEPNPKMYAEEIITAIAKNNVDERDKKLTGFIDLCELRDKYVERVNTVAPEMDKLRWTFQDILFKLLLEIRNRNEDAEGYAKKVISLRGQIKYGENGEKVIFQLAVDAWRRYEEYKDSSNRIEPTPEGLRLKALRNQKLEEAGLAL